MTADGQRSAVSFEDVPHSRLFKRSPARDHNPAAAENVRRGFVIGNDDRALVPYAW